MAIDTKGSVGLGEAYMNNEWDVERLDEFFDRLLSAELDKKLKPLNILFLMLRAKLFNMQNSRRAWKVGEQHYDLGNDFYQAMLDPRMTYTCGYWKSADNLADAQEDKLDLICRKLELEPGMRVLDIGCGWGSFMGYAAERYGVRCVGLTISKEQAKWGTEQYAGLPVEFRLRDYRDETEQFDRVVSVGMFEHVGHKNYRTFMEVARRCLLDDGLLLLHTIGNNVTQGGTDPWIHKYVFPNGELPSIAEIGASAEELFIAEDLHNFGSDYDKTLMAWHQNFEESWPNFSEQLGERFYRMWRYYLLMCAGAFRSRQIQLWQWVLSPKGVRGGYTRVS
jgi:cyclopropane-fatty-acyl-phospholipid synthase